MYLVNILEKISYNLFFNCDLLFVFENIETNGNILPILVSEVSTTPFSSISSKYSKVSASFNPNFFINFWSSIHLFIKTNFCHSSSMFSSYKFSWLILLTNSKINSFLDLRNGEKSITFIK